MWVTEGDHVVFPLRFLVEGDFVIPSAAWVTVRDTVGQVLTGFDNLAVGIGSTSSTVEIPSVHNVLPPGALFATRYVSLTFNHEGQQYRDTQHYRIIPFLPLTVGPEDVRRELGLDPSELPDREIDLYEAYFRLSADRNMLLALRDTGDRALMANRAIAIKAALDILESLTFRAAVQMKAEEHTMQRMREFDIPSIRIRLGQRLGACLDVVDGIRSPATRNFRLVTPRDALTGE